MSAGQSKQSWRTGTLVTGALLAAALMVVVTGVKPPGVPRGAVVLGAWALAAALALAGLMWRRARSQEQSMHQRYIDEPGFAQFAVTWERQWRERSTDEQDGRNRERLVNLIASALLIGAVSDGHRADVGGDAK